MPEDKRGRPQKEIREDIFEGLCKAQCTKREIYSILAVSEDTLERWVKRTYECVFAEIWQEKSAGGLVTLRRAQLRMAETNPTMAIWCGKQYLGQRDKQDVTTTIVVDELTKVRQSAAYVLQKKLDRGVAFEKAIEEMRLGEMNPEDIDWAASLSPDERQQQIQEFGRVD